jgi:hypothetical protein
MQFLGLILVQPELGPQINPAYLLVGSQAGRGATPEDHSFVDNICTIGNSEGLAYVVVGDEHADSPFA